MLEITTVTPTEIALAGRFDAAQIEKARGAFASLSTSTVVDFAKLEYISSAGLGVLLATQKRLHDRGAGLKLINVSSHIRDIFHFSGFDQIFDIS
jgi:anti-sigma B factor antagonist